MFGFNIFTSEEFEREVRSNGEGGWQPWDTRDIKSI